MGSLRASAVALIVIGGLAPAMALALTPERVERWYEGARALQDEAAEQGLADWHPADELRRVGESESAFRDAAAELEDPEQALEPHGLDSVAAWARDGARIYRALIAVDAGDLRTLEAQLEGAIQRIEESPRLGEQARAAIIADIEAQRERLTEFLASVPEADREAVSARREQVMAILRP